MVSANLLDLTPEQIAGTHTDKSLREAVKPVSLNRRGRLQAAAAKK